MNIKTLPVGQLETNCYVVINEETLECVVIDPGDESNTIMDYIESNNLKCKAIMLTHGHFDHTTAVRPILERYPDLPVYINEKDVVDGRQGDMELVFSRLPEHNQRYYHDGDTLTLGSLTITVLETPGHSKGSVCLVVGDVIFSGDTLFRCSCGRTDFAGGDWREMLRSLGRLGNLPGPYQVYPGHDQPTTLDYERRANPYVRQGMK